MLTRRLSHLVLAALLALGIVIAQARDYNFDKHYTGDSQGYLKVAYVLATTGVFSDGHYSEQAIATGPQGEGMFFAPLYPAMLAAVMKVDPVFREMGRCYVSYAETNDRRDHCPHDFGLLKYLQIGLAALALFLVWGIGYAVTGRVAVAWGAFGFAAIAEAYAYYTAFIMTEALLFPLFNLCTLLAVLCWRYRTLGLAFLLGMVFASLALTRPSYTYLFYAGVVTAPLVLWLRGEQIAAIIRLVLCLGVGYALLVGPWLMRNGTTLGHYAISAGYAPFILAQRVAYNDMTWREWGVSFVYGLPDFGDALAADLFTPDDYRRLDYGTPDGFYLTSNAALWEEQPVALRAEKLGTMLREDVFGDLFKHVMVTFSLAWRGMWVSKYWGLIAIPVFAGVFLVALRRGWGGFLVISLMPWFMLGFNAFTSVNVVRYNLVLIPCLSVALAIAILAGINQLKGRNKPSQMT